MRIRTVVVGLITAASLLAVGACDSDKPVGSSAQPQPTAQAGATAAEPSNPANPYLSVADLERLVGATVFEADGMTVDAYGATNVDQFDYATGIRHPKESDDRSRNFAMQVLIARGYENAGAMWAETVEPIIQKPGFVETTGVYGLRSYSNNRTFTAIDKDGVTVCITFHPGGDLSPLAPEGMNKVAMHIAGKM